ncbi:hypothetical protein O6H91_09G070500 [Diphasiastrum complanatum]|uniref:Uncharacterized protein n=1 Tax=Diphasiastrum complanatum TaxID=34168 RepID=A0ACC2CQD7_DIPCM|nr:hypothetical protein O6H91_09G070500 [Diphasiastrum complanatum]
MAASLFSGSRRFFLWRPSCAAVQLLGTSRSSSSSARVQRSGATVFKSVSTMARAESSGQPSFKVQKAEEEWRTVLSPEQFRILRQKGTERAGTGTYDKFYEDGIYECAGCGAPLYKSTTKFNSGCGWPAFYEGLPGAINQTVSRQG